MKRKLEELKSQIEQCKKCPLHKERTNIVFGRGDEHAQVMFIGEAPGAEEDKTGEPFVGRAGKILELFLKQNDITGYYISNIVKCRPPKNRVPYGNEVKACLTYLNKQIEIINPKFIVILGNTALKYMLNRWNISLWNGKVERKGERFYFMLLHPASAVHDPRNYPNLKEGFATLAKLLKEKKVIIMRS